MGFHSAGAGVDRQHGVEAVAVATQHVLEFQVFDLFLGDGNLVGEFLFGGVAGIEEFSHHFQVAARIVDIVEGGDPTFARVDALDDLLGLFRVVPEVGSLSFFLLFGNPGGGVVDVEIFSERFFAGDEVFDYLLVGHVVYSIW